MKVIKVAHRYELENFENKEASGQIIQFIEKEPDPENPGQLITVSDGTTHEELIEVVIDRLKTLNAKFPCKENACAITHLEEAIMWQEKRTRDRLKREVEGKHVV